MTNLRAVLAKNIKMYRSALGLSQVNLAARAKTSPSFIGMIETQNKFPSPEMIERIAEALGVDTLDLFSAGDTVLKEIKGFKKKMLKGIQSKLDNCIAEELAELEKQETAD